MIRKYKLTERLPVKRVLSKIGRISRSWNQDWVSGDVELEQWFIKQCPRFKHLTPTVLVHTTSGNIQRHTDEQSKSVFVFPIMFGKTSTLYVEDSTAHFKRGEFYRFNDWLQHGIDNPNDAQMVLVTVSFENPYWCSR